MFADPITITINAVAKNLVRVNQDSYSSTYLLKEATQEFQLNIRHTSYLDKTRGGIKVERHTAELIQTIYPVAPATQPTRYKEYFVWELDQGANQANGVYFALGFAGFQSSNNLNKMLGWES
jgi:hypothetical protein